MGNIDIARVLWAIGDPPVQNTLLMDPWWLIGHRLYVGIAELC